MWPNEQEMGRELPETPPSSPSLRGAALRLLQSSPFQRVPTRKHQAQRHQPPPGCHRGPLFFPKSQAQTPAFYLQESPPWLPRPSSAETHSTCGKRGGQGRVKGRAEVSPSLLSFPSRNAIKQAAQTRTQAVLPAGGSQKGCSPGRGRSAGPRSNYQTCLAFDVALFPLLTLMMVGLNVHAWPEASLPVTQ